jgi:hypothetical protein
MSEHIDNLKNSGFRANVNAACARRVPVSRQLTPAAFLLSAINDAFCK